MIKEWKNTRKNKNLIKNYFNKIGYKDIRRDYLYKVIFKKENAALLDELLDYVQNSRLKNNVVIENLTIETTIQALLEYDKCLAQNTMSTSGEAYIPAERNEILVIHAFYVLLKIKNNPDRKDYYLSWEPIVDYRFPEYED